MTLNLYIYCGDNPILYIDPSGHVWKTSDKKLNDDAQAKIIALTTAELNSKTTAEKKELQKKQNAIRKSSRSKSGIDTLIEINDKKQKAFINKVDKALSNGKLTLKEWKSCLKALGATYVANSSYCSTYINKYVDININISPVQITPATHYKAYVYYLPQWKNEKNDAVKSLASYYRIDKDEIGTASVSNSDVLRDSWNMMGKAVGGKDISAVVIDTHAGPDDLYFGDIDHDGYDDKNEYMYTDQIAKLGNKNIDNLILLGCNAGHLDYKYTNVAAAFSKKVNGGCVLASDGTVFAQYPLLLSWGTYSYASVNDETFYGNCLGPRAHEGNWIPDNEGWIKYQYIRNKVTISKSIGETLSIEQMLDGMR